MEAKKNQDCAIVGVYCCASAMVAIGLCYVATHYIMLPLAKFMFGRGWWIALSLSIILGVLMIIRTAKKYNDGK